MSAADPAPGTPTLPSLTSLRAFAALAVFAVHVGAFPHADGGRAGVSFFFLLSGFVLAWSARDSDRAPSFWRRRVARLLPAYLVAWALGVAVSAERGFSSALDSLPGWVLLQAWVPRLETYFGGNGVSWSLSCEAFFYLLFPLLVRRSDRVPTRAIALTAVVAGVVAVAVPVLVRSPDPNEFWTYIFPPARLSEFVLGACLGLLFRRGVRLRVPLAPAAVLTLVAVVAAGYAPAWAGTVVVTLVPFVLLLTTAASSDLAARGGSLLRAPLLVVAGSWSYCFYLVHQLVVYQLQLDGVRTPAVLLPAAFGLSVVAAGLLHHLVEVPCDRLLRGRARAPVTVVRPSC